MPDDVFDNPVSRRIWETKYRFRSRDGGGDNSVEDTWRRVAAALASVEQADSTAWAQRFLQVLEGFRFLPGGRILAGAGTDRRVTLFNCFVMGLVEDSMDGIFDALKEGALTMQQGGGVGYDFSTLRPAGTEAHSVGTVASGPVSFMRIWDSMCATLLSTGTRRGAMMATLRCDHPDIEHFITAKQDPRELRHFNLSVLVTDAFMQALAEDADWPLVFPARHLEGNSDGALLQRTWSGESTAVPCRVVRVVRARELWQSLMRATYDYAEPGVLFIDRINQLNNLGYREHISATNPCGEIPLPPYGACDLGSINLTRFVSRAFTPEACFDIDALNHTVHTAVRMLDNITDLSRYPLEQQREQALATRRIGLGITGLADALLMLGLRYGEPASLTEASAVMRAICHGAYRCSTLLAQEKGVFPAFERDQYLQRPFIQALPDDIRAAIAAHGIRNSHLTAIAPTGTISLLANNISSSLEPVFAFRTQRRILQAGGDFESFEVVDHACRQYQAQCDDREALPPQFVDAAALNPQDHLRMQSAIQPWVDNAISKTINVPGDYDFDAFRSLYEEAYAAGLKGCTTFRPNPVTGAVLVPDTGGAPSHCCSIERESE